MFSLGDDELDEYLKLTEAMFDMLDPFDAQAPAVIENIHATREIGRRPNPGEDPYNAIIRWCRVVADREGVLSGKRVGLKDNMAVAGVPMTFGSRLIDGYIPETDCVVVERLLSEGAEIVATLNLDSFAWSGGGETSHFGPILNPRDPTRTAAGSSGGSAAALYYDEVDITFGTDQGGSIRLPASWCGVLGHKPTYSLVPYTGIGGIDSTFDHVGPLARSVEDLALALEVVAGKHESDPRQHDVPVEKYLEAVQHAADDFHGFRIGVLKEGFGWASRPNAPPGTVETEEAVLGVVEKLREAGASVTEVSVPRHLAGAAMTFTTLMEGQTALLHSFGNGYHFRGRYAPDLAIALGKGLRSHGDELPPTVKLVALLGSYLREYYFSSLYAKAQNLAPLLRAEYDRALETVDFLIMPTTTHYAHVHDPHTSISEKVLRGWSMPGNTGATDATGHPALSMPAAEADGLPVGVMVVGKMFADGEVLSFAKTYEEIYGWNPMVKTLEPATQRQG